MRLIVAPLATVALVWVGSQVGSAQVRQEDPTRRQQPRGEQSQPHATDTVEAKLAGWLATCNNIQVQISEIAAQKATDPEVKQFAQQMVEEHREFNAQLAQFVAAGDRELLRAGTSDRVEKRERAEPGEQPQTREQVQRQTRTEAHTRSSGDDPFMQIGKQAAHKKAELLTRVLEEKQGAEFDMCYMGLQVFAHINFVAELEAMQDHGSEQFQQVVSRAAQTTEDHLQRAKQLTQKVGSSRGPADRVSRRPEQQDRQQEQERP